MKISLRKPKMAIILMLFFSALCMFAQTASNYGSFDFSYPLELPPGAGSVTPELQLSYSSSSGNGLFGEGWNLSGTGAIMRDRSYPVNYDENDHFTYNGQKLIFKGYSNGARLYQTEAFNSERISWLNYTNQDDSSWLVERQDGTRFHYGHTNYSKLAWDVPDMYSKNDYIWYLGEVEDVHGNSAYYVYGKYEGDDDDNEWYKPDEENTAYYLKKIIYTVTRKNYTETVSEVWFVSKERGDSETVFKPYEMAMDRLISAVYVVTNSEVKINDYNQLSWSSTAFDQIEAFDIEDNNMGSISSTITSHGQNLLRMYRFNYENDDFTNGARLVSIDESGTDSSVFFPATTFDYTGSPTETELRAKYNAEIQAGNPNYANSFDNALVESGGSQLYNLDIYDEEDDLKPGALIQGDFNCDGKMDYIDRNEDTFGIYYSNGTNTFTHQDPLSVTDSNFNDDMQEIEKNTVLTGDFNGDMRTDFLLQKEWEMVVYLAQENGYFQHIQTEPFGYSDPDDVQIMTVDFNGDGKTDIFQNTGTPQIYFSNGDGTFEEKNTNMGNCGDHRNFESDVSVITGDFNGDGLSDILTHSKFSQFDQLYYSVGTGDFILIDIETNLYDGLSDYDIISGDFNGDGKSDLFLTTRYEENGGSIFDDDKGDSEFVVLFSVGNGKFNREYHYNLENILPTDNGFDRRKASFGDFNGDGMTDFIYHENEYVYQAGGYGSGDRAFYAFISTGTGIFDIIRTDLFGGKTSGWYFWEENENILFTIGDFNGDGKDDFLSTGVMDSSDNQMETVRIFHSKLDYYYQKPENMEKITNPNGGTVNVDYIPATYLDGAIDSFYKTETLHGSYDKVTYISPPSKSNLVSSITMKCDIDGSDFSNSYSYSGYRLANWGDNKITNLGYSEFTINNDQTGTKTKQFYLLAPYGAGKVEKVHAIDSSGLIIKEETSVYTNDSSNNFTYVNEKKSTYTRGTHPVSDHTRTLYTYDVSTGRVTTIENLGLVNYQSVDFGNDKSISTTTFKTMTSPRYLVLPVSAVSQAYDLDGNFVTLNTEKMYYYSNDGDNFTDTILPYGSIGQRGLVAKRETDDNDSNTINPVVYSTYDSYGNETAIKDIQGNISSTKYDSTYHLYPEVETNPLGHKLRYYYNEYNHHSSTVDQGNKTWYIIYDDFGRVIKQYSPGDGSNPGTGFIFKNGRPTYKETRVKEADTGNFTTGTGYLLKRDYYNGFGQLIQEKVESSTAGKYTTQLYKYNSIGGISQKSLPFETSTINFSDLDINSYPHTSFEYDLFGNLTKKTDPDRTFIEYKSYGLTEEIHTDKEGYVTNTKINGTEKYLYAFADANIGEKPPLWTWEYRQKMRTASNGTRTWDADGNMIESLADSFGRIVSISDPALGTRTFTHNDLGQRETQTDARGRRARFYHDSLGRLVKSVYGENYTWPIPDISEYHYDDYSYAGTNSYDSSNAIGLLTRISYKNGTKEFFYDQRRNIIESVHTIDGLSRTMKYNYDPAGRLVSKTYPDGEVVNQTYDNQGNIESIIGNNPYINSTDFTSGGLLSKVVFGNNVSENYDYYDTSNEIDTSNGNNYSMMVKNYTLKNSNGGSISSTDLTYEVTGFIKTKTIFSLNSGIGNFTESYTYDALGRLTNADGGSLYGVKAYKYNNIDSILEKDGKAYEYNAIAGYVGADNTRPLPHAVSRIGDNFYQYDLNGNQTVVTSTNQADIKIWAKGGGVNWESHPPKMQLSVNGKIHQTWTVTNSEYQSYGWSGDWDGESAIKVIFPNDYYSGGNDTNLLVDKIDINGVTIEAESQNGDVSIHLTNGATKTPRESLSWNGEFRFSPDVDPLYKITTYHYNSSNYLVEVSGTIYSDQNTTFKYEYAYDDEGHRVKKEEDGATTYYFFNEYEEKIDSTSVSTKYYYSNGRKIAQKRSNSDIEFIHGDSAGSTIMITDSNGNTIYEAYYEPFGKVAVSSGFNYTNYGYTGQENDISGLMYYGARSYSPDMGRFIQPDDHSDQLNRYAYVANNPVNFTDPTGNFITWGVSFDNSGNWSFQIGFNLSPIGIPLGAGLNVGKDYVGFYVEAAYRIGGYGGVGVEWGNNFYHSGDNKGAKQGYLAIGGGYDFTGSGFCDTSAFVYIVWDYEDSSKVVAGFGFSQECFIVSAKASFTWNVATGEFLGASVTVGYDISSAKFSNALNKMSKNKRFFGSQTDDEVGLQKIKVSKEPAPFELDQSPFYYKKAFSKNFFKRLNWSSTGVTYTPYKSHIRTFKSRSAIYSGYKSQSTFRQTTTLITGYKSGWSNCWVGFSFNYTPGEGWSFWGIGVNPKAGSASTSSGSTGL